MKKSKYYLTALSISLFLSSTWVHAKPASEITKQKNQALFAELPFSDRQDFADAQRGLLLKPDTLIIKDQTGRTVWDLESFKKVIQLEKPAPASVNPSLWRNAQLNIQYGLFEVVDGIYQVRGYDLANITFVRSNQGWIVFDTGTAVEVAEAAYGLISEKFGKKPIQAVVISHSHVDHFGGIKGLINEADVKSGKVKVIAPEGFMQHTVSENVIAGNAMSRRYNYMSGFSIPRSEEGSVGLGLGLITPSGTVTLIEPNLEIKKTGEKLTIDGVEMVFQMTPGSEAPAEMNTYLPQFKAMWMAENTQNTLHNILTLRGAEVRDAKKWAEYINETIDLYGSEIEVKFQSHHWPVWGNDRVIDYLNKQRDVYKYMHDQTVYLMNQGYTGVEIANKIKLPESLDHIWSSRGYYGTLSHNAKAIYQRYLGWYDANPSSLDELTTVDAAKKYVEYMGGEKAILDRAAQDFKQGNYRWVAMVLKQVVFANPNQVSAKNLLADSYEQLAYLSESGKWRSIYLQGAHELRHGLPEKPARKTTSIDLLNALSPDLIFDYLSVRLNAERANGKKLRINFNVTDLNQQYSVSVENSVMNYSKKFKPNADLEVSLDHKNFKSLMFAKADITEKIKAGEVKTSGDLQALDHFRSLIDNYVDYFNVVTPRP